MSEPQVTDAYNPMPMDTEVHKFGGTSVGSVERIRACADRIAEARTHRQPIVVTSAMQGVTDSLFAAARQAASGASPQEHVEHFRTLHAEVAEGIGHEVHELDELLEQLEERLTAARVTSDASERTRDAIVPMGEKLAARLLAAALRAIGIPARAVDADAFLETNATFGRAEPIPQVAETSIRRALEPVLDSGVTPVVTGYCGRAPDGSTTTLGRGGSDWSATLLARAMDSDRVVIWTDVHGLSSADPRIVPEARTISHLHYQEAAELSRYGARVLHQRTIPPAADRGIPIEIRNAMEPDGPVTIIDSRSPGETHAVKGISATPEQVMISVEGHGMTEAPGTAARVLEALTRADIDVTMISHRGSTSPVRLAVSDADASRAEHALREELARGAVNDLDVQRGVAVVAVVGRGVARSPGVTERISAALEAEGVRVIDIAHGTSELNISLAVPREDAERTIRAIHAGFRLGRAAGEDRTRHLDLVLLGLGAIGRGLLDLIDRSRAEIIDRTGLTPRITGICDRSAHLLDPAGLSPEVIAQACAHKRVGGTLASLPGAVPHTSPADLLGAAADWQRTHPVLVDVSDGDFEAPLFVSAYKLGMDVVTANKRPLAGPPQQFDQIVSGALSAGRRLLAEATVGAGLPVLETVDSLIASGDPPHLIEGCLSGTLAFVLGQIETGTRLSEAVKSAVDQGYTEPDPAIDLAGLDVARKALILGRLSRLLDADARVDSAPFIDDLPTDAGDALFSHLRLRDDDVAARMAAARSNGNVLRYVARIESGHATVGLREVPAASPLGGLAGTDNMLVFTSNRPDSRPLIISGPGAGVDVTTMAVLTDILRIAEERSSSPAGRPRS